MSISLADELENAIKEQESLIQSDKLAGNVVKEEFHKGVLYGLRKVAGMSNDYKQILECPGTNVCHTYSGSCTFCFRRVYSSKDNFRPRSVK